MRETSLFARKWFDYRPLSPDGATLAFFYAWAKALTQFNEYIGDSKWLNFLKRFESFKPDYLKRYHARYWRTMTKLRKWADKRGMPYDFYWTAAFEGFIELKFRYRFFVESYLSERLNNDIWQKFTSRQIVLKSSLPFFRADNYQGWEVQDDYYHYLVREIMQTHGQPEIYLPHIERLVRDGEIAPEFLAEKSIIARSWKKYQRVKPSCDE